MRGTPETIASIIEPIPQCVCTWYDQLRQPMPHELPTIRPSALTSIIPVASCCSILTCGAQPVMIPLPLSSTFLISSSGILVSPSLLTGAGVAKMKGTIGSTSSRGFEEVRDQLHAVFRPGIAAESNEGGTVRTIFLERFVQEAEESLVILGRFADPLVVGLNPNGLIELWAGTD
jgi:hypothetical protein